ncbi:major outer membrane protein OmpA [Candidatus Symbiothrix dinenymphae]|nr:major outer membrane protein OmpA [Candidatus Symbiothrix dinenymphae]
MKKIFFTTGFLLLAWGTFAQSESPLAVESQYPSDARAKTMYNGAVAKQVADPRLKIAASGVTWLTDAASSNWFVSVQGGLGGILSQDADMTGFLNFLDEQKKYDALWRPTFGGSFGRWTSPVSGWRFSGSYGTVQAFEQNGSAIDTTQSYLLFTADYMLNLKNLFLPYNHKGFFNPVVYVGVGIININDTVSARHKGGMSFVTKAGVQFNFRVADGINLFLDPQFVLIPAIGHKNSSSAINFDAIFNVNLGVTYRFNFRHFIKAPLYNQPELDALNAAINTLTGEVEELRNRPTACPECPECPEEKVAEETVTFDPVFFLVNSHVVRENQMLTIAKAADYLKNHPGTKLGLHSFADKDSGTSTYNQKLSKKRGEAVAEVMTTRFNVARDRLVLKFFGGDLQPFEEKVMNRVTIFIYPEGEGEKPEPEEGLEEEAEVDGEYIEEEPETETDVPETTDIPVKND